MWKCGTTRGHRHEPGSGHVARLLHRATAASATRSRPDVANAAKGSDVECQWQCRRRPSTIVACPCVVLAECLPWYCQRQSRTRLSMECADLGGVSASPTGT